MDPDKESYMKIKVVRASKLHVWWALPSGAAIAGIHEDVLMIGLLDIRIRRVV